MTFKKSFAVFALFLGAAVLATGIAWAGDDVPAVKPAAEAKAAPAKTAAETPATKTASPIHTLLKWVGSQVTDGDCGCPSTEKGAAAWGAWFKGGKDVPLSSLRDAMVADGWTEARFVGFFKEMAAAKAAKGECCGGCDKGAAGDAAGAADAKEGGKCCGGCDKAKKDCGGCDKNKADGAGAADAKEGGKSCGGCDKAKKGCGGCDKDKADGASAADASESGTCPCTGKDKADCPGCDKAGCGCGKDKGASEKPVSDK